MGLSEVANKRVGDFSLGMKQRLGLAAAMLGDPQTLLFDEPANGLDPEGIQWMRQFLKGLADEGRTVFVSSHLLTEMALIADDLVVIGKGSLIYQGGVQGFIDGSATSWVTVRSPQLEQLARWRCETTAPPSRPTSPVPSTWWVPAPSRSASWPPRSAPPSTSSAPRPRRSKRCSWT